MLIKMRPLFYKVKMLIFIGKIKCNFNLIRMKKTNLIKF